MDNHSSLNGRARSDVGAVGHRVSFEAWQHDSLVRFAYEAHARINELEADLKAAMAAYRELLKRNQ